MNSITTTHASLDLDPDMKLVFDQPDLPNLVQTPPDESSVGMFTFLAIYDDGTWSTVVGHKNGARTDGWFEGLIEGQATYWEEIEWDVPEAAARFLAREIDIAVVTANYDGSYIVDSITDSTLPLPRKDEIRFWLWMYYVDELWPDATVGA